ncbi:TPA: hypothetical protein IAA92_00950 [Candidatus Galligastranaerophilus intestinigallinarum]|nr:hypothetical protein [Candidatus Galligastranaerophilus intestinigallinarum]
MIIKKKVTKEQKEEVEINQTNRSRNIIKAGTGKVNALKKKALEKKEKKELEKELENASKNENIKPEKPKEKKEKTELETKLDEYEKVDVTLLEFKERYERRRGERRRGFRRIDERALVSRAQEEARTIREVAAKEGYKNGLLEAENEISMLKDTLSQIVSARKEAYEEMSGHILEIALEVAKKIIKKEVSLSNDVLKSVLAEVFNELGSNEEKITVKVNPEDVEFAKASIPEILADSPIDAKIIVTSDELVEKGSCTVVASNGVIDANFTTQLSIIQNAFGIYKGGE